MLLRPGAMHLFDAAANASATTKTALVQTWAYLEVHKLLGGAVKLGCVTREQITKRYGELIAGLAGQRMSSAELMDASYDALATVLDEVASANPQFTLRFIEQQQRAVRDCWNEQIPPEAQADNAIADTEQEVGA